MSTDKKTNDSYKKIAEIIYPNNCNYYIRETSTGKYEVGYTNDYPQQHGDGEKCIIPASLMNFLIEKALPTERETPVAVDNKQEEQVKDTVRSAEEVLKDNLVRYFRPSFSDAISDDNLYKIVRVFHEEETAIISAMHEYKSQSAPIEVKR